MEKETKDTILELRKINKSFGGKYANKEIDFEVKAGEVHALLGENGAGKTTLMNILYGLYKPDGGTIIFEGKECVIHSPKDAIEQGIGMVHQHFMLVPRLSVLENIILGMSHNLKPLEYRKVREEVKALCGRYTFKIDPDRKIMDLSVGEQQKVELIKALYRNARLLIMDEPTAVLTPLEVEELFHVLKDLVKEGKSVIFISHKLWEVLKISRRITVLRLGEVVGTVDTASATRESLASMMVGRSIISRYDKIELRGETSILRLDQVSASGGFGGTSLKELTLQVKEGEILGVAGVDGNGQKELGEILSGLKKIEKGKIFLKEDDISTLPVKERTTRGMSFIPEDRLKQGLILEFSIAENLVLDEFDRTPFTSKGIYSPRIVTTYGSEKIVEYDIRSAGVQTIVRKLSGGNQQKVVIARALSRRPKFILAMQPTRGLDVGASEFVYKRLLEERARGAGVLMVSADLDEILLIADRVVVLYEGKISGEFVPGEADFTEIGLMMGGGEKT